MTVIIASNENGIQFVFDSRLQQKAFAVADTPDGTYWSISAAFSGEELKVIFFQQTGDSYPTYIDPLWAGILPMLTSELESSQDNSFLTDYLDLISPIGTRLKKAIEDYLNESVSSNFDLQSFKQKISTRYALKECQAETVINYGIKTQKTATNKKADSLKILDTVFDNLRRFMKGVLVGDESLENTLESMNGSMNALENVLENTNSSMEILEDSLGRVWISINESELSLDDL
jgi:hypothetical protein